MSRSKSRIHGRTSKFPPPEQILDWGATNVSEPGRAFAFRVKAMGLDVAEWRYTFEPTPAGCVVTEQWTDRRGALLKVMSPKVTGVADRAEHNRNGMEQTLERLATAAETSSPPR